MPASDESHARIRVNFYVTDCADADLCARLAIRYKRTSNADAAFLVYNVAVDFG